MSIITTTDSYLTPFADDNSTMAPPDPFPNSEVKHRSANGSVVCSYESTSALYSKLNPLCESKEGFFMGMVLTFLSFYLS